MIATLNGDVIPWLEAKVAQTPKKQRRLAEDARDRWGSSIGGRGGTVCGSAYLHNRLTHSVNGYEYTLEGLNAPYKKRMDGILLASPRPPRPQVVSERVSRLT